MFPYRLYKGLDSVSWKLFKEFISADFGAIHGCYVSEYDSGTSQLDIFWSEMGSDTGSGLQCIADDLENAIEQVISDVNSDGAL